MRKRDQLNWRNDNRVKDYRGQTRNHASQKWMSNPGLRRSNHRHRNASSITEQGLACDCAWRHTESGDRKDPRGTTNILSVQQSLTSPPELPSPPSSKEQLNFLYSSKEELGADVGRVRVPDQGSQLQCVCIQIQGMPVYGVIDR